MGERDTLVAALAERYEVEREIGVGGMATVYLARDVKHDRKVALKVLKPELGAVIGVERFLAEIKVTANLQHPNLLPLFDSGEANGLLFYVMPFVDGESLRSRLDRERQLPIEEAIRIAAAVAAALDYAHQHGVIHRDLKPENILLQAGQPVVADFGIALAVSKAGGQRVTQTGLSLGTPQYMSPEQATGDRTVDSRTDIYSLGAMVYEMLTGEPPHVGANAQSIIAKLMTEDVRPVAVLRRNVPMQVDAAVLHALEKLAADRFATAGEFSLALQGKGNPAALSGYSAVRQGSPPRSVSQRRAFVGATVAAAVVLGAGIWKLAVAISAPPPRVLRLAVSLPPRQRFVDAVGSVLFTADGKAIVYPGQGPKGSQLYYRRLDQVEGTPLPGTDNVCCPAVSPSGDWVAFEGNGGVSKVSVHGGAPIVLGKSSYNGGLFWGADDAIYSAEAAQGLFRIPANGGPVIRVAVPDTAQGQTSWYMPLVLPDLKTALVFSYMRTGGNRVVAVNLADGKATTLTGPGSNPIGLVGGFLTFGRNDSTLGVVPFVPGRTRTLEALIPVTEAPLYRNNGMEASVSAAGDLVYVKGVSGNRITLLDGRGRLMGANATIREFQHPRFSPDGRKIAVSDRTGDVWLYDIASDVLQRLTTGLTGGNTPAWSADGRRIAYTAKPDSQPRSVWWIPADRSGPPERLAALPIPIGRLAFSPDGRYLVLSGNDPKTKYDLYLVDLKGDRKPVLLEQSPANDVQPAVSPDGHWLAFVSDESGRYEVYVRPFPANGAHVQISSDGGTEPRWEKDSRGIVYSNEARLMKARLNVGATVTVVQRDSVFTLITDTYTRYYDMSPAGAFVMLRPESVDAEIIVVTNWIAELKAKSRR